MFLCTVPVSSVQYRTIGLVLFPPWLKPLAPALLSRADGNVMPRMWCAWLLFAAKKPKFILHGVCGGHEASLTLHVNVKRGYVRYCPFVILFVLICISVSRTLCIKSAKMHRKEPPSLSVLFRVFHAESSGGNTGVCVFFFHFTVTASSVSLDINAWLCKVRPNLSNLSSCFSFLKWHLRTNKDFFLVLFQMLVSLSPPSYLKVCDDSSWSRKVCSRPLTWSHRSKVWQQVDVLTFGFSSFFFSLQDSLRGRPKEIPHNEKLLSLKYEVKDS